MHAWWSSIYRFSVVWLCVLAACCPMDPFVHGCRQAACSTGGGKMIRLNSHPRHQSLSWSSLFLLWTSIWEFVSMYVWAFSIVLWLRKISWASWARRVIIHTGWWWLASRLVDWLRSIAWTAMVQLPTTRLAAGPARPAWPCACDA